MRSKSKISRQRVPWSVREESKDGLADWFADRIDTSFFNQICGNTAETRTKYTGLNAVTAPDASHIIRAGALATDQAVQADSTKTFELNLIDKAVTRARTLSPMIRPFNVKGRKKYVMFLHPYQVFSLRTSTSSGQWLDIQKAAMQGGDVSGNPIYSGALGEYNGVILHEATRVTTGVHSTSGAAQSNVRRAVLCGAQAAAIAFGKGQGFEQWEWIEDEFDYEREYGVSAQTIIGIKKSVYNSKDFSTIVVPTYAAEPA